MGLQRHMLSMCRGFLLRSMANFEFQHLIFRKLGVSPPESNR